MYFMRMREAQLDAVRRLGPAPETRRASRLFALPVPEAEPQPRPMMHGTGPSPRSDA